MDDVMLSVGLGGGLGVLYVAASLATARMAGRYRDGRFMLLFLGGMIARLGVAVVVVLVVLIRVAVHRPAFIGTLLVVFLLGLVVEVWIFHRRLTDRRGRDA